VARFDPHISRTTTAMLSALHDAEDVAAWEAFDERYRPILHRVGRQLGLSDADAADLAQDVTVRFIQRYREGAYDRKRGRLGAWLAGIARNAAIDLHRRRRKSVPIESLAEQVADPDDVEDLWRRCRQDRILEVAMALVRDAGRTDPRTFEAFQLVSIRGVAPSEVADSLGISIESVYAARSRVARRLQEAVAEVERDYDEEV
jgi:RNA polymerase sigma-70 factor (ECF subfamily)